MSEITWTIAYRKPRANHFRRVSNWSGTWHQAFEVAGTFASANPDPQVYYIPTVEAENANRRHTEDIGNILTDSGKRIKIRETGTLSTEMLAAIPPADEAKERFTRPSRRTEERAMDKKYKIVDGCIVALRDFGDIKAGTVGGFVSSETNLSHDGNAWVFGGARVNGDAQVSGNAQVSGDAHVYGNARVFGDARVYGGAQVYGNAWVFGNARVYGDAWVYGNARVFDDARVYGSARVLGNARVLGIVRVSGNISVSDDAHVYGSAWIYGNARVSGSARVSDD